MKVSLNSLHEMGEKHFGEMFRLCQLRIADVTSRAYNGDYVVTLSHGDFSFCVDVDFVDDAGERITLRLWKPFEKVIGMTAQELYKLPLARKEKAFSDMGGMTMFDVVVKLNPDGPKIAGLYLV